MNKTLTNLIASIIALYVIAWIFPGVHITNFTSAIIAAIVFGCINAFIKPVIQILSIPLTIVTLGFFSLVINAFMLMLTSSLVQGFYVNNFSTAFFAAIILSILNLVFINGESR